MKLLKRLLPLALLGAVSVNTHAIPVDLELSLVIDVSGSVNASEYNLQMDGYANAFRSNTVQDAILGGTVGSIAVNSIFFSSSASEGIGFTLLDSAAAINSFADVLDNFARPFSGGTTIASGLNLSVPSFGDETGGVANGFESARQVIDVSGDGQSNILSTQAARDNALAAGIDAINGIAIEFNDTSTTITDFYRDNVIGGTGSFVETAAGFASFQDAITRKLFREISNPNPVSEPSTLVLLSLGLFGLAFARRRKHS